MRNIITIFRRDLGAYFKSPIGYIFIIVFLLISVGLYMTTFFAYPVADMRQYFSNLPLLLCVFVPAVTMRVWAEERKENTWEMLLTFPMRASELVLGKFLACLAFFLITLCATVTVPLMLAVLGSPDFGVIFGGYLGTFLLGAFFLAIGIFVSGLCKDQIVAFVITLLACFMLFFVGANFVAAYIDSLAPRLGTTLAQLVGIIDHYNPFTRGVVEMADVLYFGAWTVLFLVLNILYIEGRNRPGARVAFSTAVALCVGIGLLFNWLISGQSIGRFDLTEDKIYTVSEASAEILSELDVPAQVRVYITPSDNMPTAFANLERDIRDKLEELRVASGGMIEYTSVPLVARGGLTTADLMGEDDPEDEEAALKRRMFERGVQPFGVQTIDEDQVSTKMIYSSIGIAYRDREEEFIPQVVPQTLPDLEYQLVSTIYKAAREEPPIVAMVAPEEAVHIEPQIRQMLEQMGEQIPDTEDPFSNLQQLLQHERYEVRRVELTEESPLPDEFDVLLALNPRQFNERRRYEINRVLNEGKPVILAVQNYQFDYQPGRDGIQLHKRDEAPQINELLAEYGVEVDRDVLLDANSFPLTIQGGDLMSQLFGGGQQVDAPMHIRIHSASLDSEWSITNRLSELYYIWGSALALDESRLAENDLEARVLASTGERAWKAPTPQQITLEPPESTQRYPIMAYISGRFPDVYADQPTPEWGPPQEPAMGEQPLPPPEMMHGPGSPMDEAETDGVEEAGPEGALILIGGAEMFRNHFLGAGNNLELILNSVDALALGDQIVHVRGRRPVDRTIEQPSQGQRAFWRFVNYALVNIVIAGIGTGTALCRRRSRNAYTMMYQRDSQGGRS